MTWALVLDLLGTFFFAISGSLLAAQRGFDIIGSLLLGGLTGLGSGVIRDLIIGRPLRRSNGHGRPRRRGGRLAGTRGALGTLSACGCAARVLYERMPRG